MARSKPAAKEKPAEKEAGSTFHNLSARRADYQKTVTGKGKNAIRSIDCGDDLAEGLRTLPLDKVYSKASKALGVTAKSLKEKYGHLNNGMQRMNLGNRLRAALRREAEAK